MGHLWSISDILLVSGLADKIDLCGNHDEIAANGSTIRQAPRADAKNVLLTNGLDW
jgi:hypothetical protein